jgi:hypothetical protein
MKKIIINILCIPLVPIFFVVGMWRGWKELIEKERKNANKIKE